MAKIPEFNCLTCKTRPSGYLAGVPESILKELNEVIIHNIYHKGQVLFYQGSQPFGVFCLNSGKIKLSKNDNGNENIVHIAQPGEIIGFTPFFTENICNLTAEAIEDTTVCFLDKNKFIEVIKKYPPLFSILLDSLENEDSCSVKNTFNKLVMDFANEKALELIRELKDSHAIKISENYYKLDIPVTRDDLICMLEMPEPVSVQMVNYLEEKGVISFKCNYLYLNGSFDSSVFQLNSKK